MVLATPVFGSTLHTPNDVIMEPSFRRCAPGATILLLAQLFLTCHSVSQVKPRLQANARNMTMAPAATADTSPIRKAYLERRLRTNTDLIRIAGHVQTVDTVPSLEPWLATKESCDFEKSLTPDGCILVKYKDGFTKKVCKGKTTEIIMPDGKKHVLRWGNSTAYMYVSGLPAPPNPDAQAPTYKWLTNYNEGLMNDILLFLGNQSDLIDQYKQNEAIKCSGNIYKQIEYRTIFIETFLEAK